MKKRPYTVEKLIESVAQITVAVNFHTKAIAALAPMSAVKNLASNTSQALDEVAVRTKATELLLAIALERLGVEEVELLLAMEGRGDAQTLAAARRLIGTKREG